MERLEIKDWYVASQIDLDKGPPNPQDFCIDFRVDVGEIGEEAVTNYQVFVCTPLGLLSNFDSIGEYLAKSDDYRFYGDRPACFFGRGILIVREYGIETVLATLRDVIQDIGRYAVDVT